MNQIAPAAPESIQPVIERALARLKLAAPDPALWPQSEALEAGLRQLAVTSDFAIDTLCRQPELLQLLAQADPAPLPLPALDPLQPTAWPTQLRRYRAAASTRLIWRDLLELDDVDATLAGATRLAEECLQLGLEALEQEFASRHGVVRDADGSAQRLVVFGLGKLGGGELNFSSDIDLVYAYPHNGESDGARPLAAEEYFAHGRDLVVHARQRAIVAPFQRLAIALEIGVRAHFPAARIDLDARHGVIEADARQVIRRIAQDDYASLEIIIGVQADFAGLRREMDKQRAGAQQCKGEWAIHGAVSGGGKA